MMELGAIGSVVDVATFIAVMGLILYEVQPRQEVLAAAVVALAEGRKDVDHEHLQAELEVEDVDVDQVRPTIVDGGEA